MKKEREKEKKKLGKKGEGESLLEDPSQQLLQGIAGSGCGDHWPNQLLTQHKLKHTTTCLPIIPTIVTAATDP